MFNYEKIPLHWVNRLGFVLRKELSAVFREAGHPVSPEEWAILLVLWKQSPQTPGALADVTTKDRTTITRLIDAMVRKNLVSRSEDPDDRRRSVVAVSAHGVAMQEDLVRLAQGLINRALTDIPADDIETTTRTLRAMTENLLVPAQSASGQRISEDG
ncbi:MarR family winged helix-turn-helix transcriptional regulator [Roseicitreum antarcticum]|uniref:DNA-binding transcriptional regulator, MarR family n=1 Tax=Roseicitreum antarcticum TaxID=564137 RepID=A0A1H3DDI9_9RHOB|nr:MarR family winged helix-turn-helix transcriptional regulator [Roseicitreum antarcticum]SDX64461.1 DNA-binding transcriptional regulator, MarR family [Roseicitreum antarcticum]